MQPELVFGMKPDTPQHHLQNQPYLTEELPFTYQSPWAASVRRDLDLTPSSSLWQEAGDLQQGCTPNSGSFKLFRRKYYLSAAQASTYPINHGLYKTEVRDLTNPPRALSPQLCQGADHSSLAPPDLFSALLSCPRRLDQMGSSAHSPSSYFDPVEGPGR